MYKADPKSKDWAAAVLFQQEYTEDILRAKPVTPEVELPKEEERKPIQILSEESMVAVDRIKEINDKLNELFDVKYPSRAPNWNVFMKAAAELKDLAIKLPLEVYSNLIYELLSGGKNGDIYTAAYMLRWHPKADLLPALMKAMSAKKYRGTVAWQALDAIHTVIADPQLAKLLITSENDWRIPLRNLLIRQGDEHATHPNHTGNPFATTVVWGKILQICQVLGFDAQEIFGFDPERYDGLSIIRLAQELKAILEEHRTWQVTDGAKGKRAILSGRVLRQFNLSGENLMWADLRKADLSGANLRDADLHGADLREATLVRTDLLGAKLIKANLSQANLSRAQMRYAILNGTDLTAANLSDTDLREVDLRMAKILPEQLRVAIKDKTTIGPIIIDETSKSTIFYLAADRLNMREGPGTGFPFFARLERGEEVQKLGEMDDWYQVRAQRYGTLGWVYSKYLRNKL